MQFQRIYVDTNIFIRAAESSPADDIAQSLIGMLGLIKVGEQARFLTSQLTLAEVLVHPLRKKDEQLRQYYINLLSRMTPWLQVRSIGQQTLVLAAEVRAAARMKLPDAIHLATAMSANCSHIISSDADFEQYEGLAGFTRPTVIRPTAENLARIVAWLRQ